MSDNRFSGGGATTSGGDDKFGYFAPGQAPGGPAAPPSQFGGGPAAPASGSSQFGGAPAAPSQFGTPPPNPFGAPPGPDAPFGSPTPYAAPPASKSSGTAKRVLIVFAVLLVVGGALFGYRVWKHMQPVNLPATVDGLAQTNNAQVANAIDTAQKNVQDQNPGLQVQFKAYGTVDTKFAIVGAARGRSNVNMDFNDFGNGIEGRTQVGNSTCATSTVNHVTVCERTGGDLTVLVAEVARSETPGTGDVAAAVDEVWNQL